MYLTLFARKYRPTYRQLCLKLRRALYRQLNSALNLHCFYRGEANLNLNLYSYLNLNLNLNLNPQSYRSLFVSSFGALYRKKYRSFDGSVYPALSPQLQLPRRPPGRGVDGRIMVLLQVDTTYGMAAILGTSPSPELESPLFPASSDRMTSRK